MLRSALLAAHCCIVVIVLLQTGAPSPRLRTRVIATASARALLLACSQLHAALDARCLHYLTTASAFTLQCLQLCINALETADRGACGNACS